MTSLFINSIFTEVGHSTVDDFYPLLVFLLRQFSDCTGWQRGFRTIISFSPHGNGTIYWLSQKHSCDRAHDKWRLEFWLAQPFFGQKNHMMHLPWLVSLVFHLFCLNNRLLFIAELYLPKNMIPSSARIRASTSVCIINIQRTDNVSSVSFRTMLPS